MHKNRKLAVLLLLATMLTLSACNSIRGSGALITETRQISNFDKIALSGSGEVIVTQSGSESLSIETDKNVMKYIEAEVKGGILTLGIKENVNVSPTHLVFYVSVDNLSGLTVSGSGKIGSDKIETNHLDVLVSGSGEVQIADITASEVKAEVSGSGAIDLVGEAAAQNVTVSGSGKYLAGDVCSASVAIYVSGSGDATVCATGRLDANNSGSGSIKYYGQPTVNTSSSGSGTIKSLGDK